MVAVFAIMPARAGIGVRGVVPPGDNSASCYLIWRKLRK
jgi:hypothetical protein